MPRWPSAEKQTRALDHKPGFTGAWTRGDERGSAMFNDPRLLAGRGKRS
jgi:hypothetical protein